MQNNHATLIAEDTRLEQCYNFHMAHLLVIGGASIDTLHFAGQEVVSAGGAGMYTAMAAHRGGIKVSMLSPRPEPIPEALHPVAERLSRWLGPLILPEELAHFEIVHREEETIYLKASLGAESSLSPDDLPPDLSIFDGVHLTPFLDAQRQLEFLQACRQRGAKCISAGTFIDVITHQPGFVSAIMDQVDYFFMNEKESIEIFGSIEQAKTKPGKVLFVTLGKKGALVIQGECVTHLPAVPSKALDPTGAGDTFCGITLAYILQGHHPVMAASAATLAAAQMIEHPGPEALFWPQKHLDIPIDTRAWINDAQIQKVSRLIAMLTEVKPFDFTGSEFPPVGHPAAVDFFFSSTLQQFGFWTAVNGKYRQPLIAPIDGMVKKGSSYLWQAYMRPLAEDPEFYAPERQAHLTHEEMLKLFRADDLTDPMPAMELHLSQSQQYGRDMQALNLSTREVINQSQSSSKPLKTFFELLDHVGGYKEDPLRKKTGLLAMILNQRPEQFLSFADEERLSPVIDYHAMRTCLRVGLIDVHDADFRAKLAGRYLLQPADEWAVRYASYTAIEQVAATSGKSMGAVDWFFFNSRRRCPEMTEPECSLCPVDPVCAHHKELFQPAIRTTFY